MRTIDMPCSIQFLLNNKDDIDVSVDINNKFPIKGTYSTTHQHFFVVEMIYLLMVRVEASTCGKHRKMI